MKTIRIVIIFLLVVFQLISVNTVYSQVAYYFGAGATVHKNDSVVIRLNDYVGKIQWQRSYNLDDWMDLPGATAGSYIFKADTTSYFRAIVTVETCDPFFSDTTLVNVYQTKDGVEIIDHASLNLTSDSADLEKGIYRFTGQNENIAVGNVILGQQDEGFIRKVIDLERDGDDLIMLTEQATIADVFEDFYLKDSIIIKLDQRKSAIQGAKLLPVNVLYLPRGASLKNRGSGINFSGSVIFDGMVNDGVGNSARIKVGVEEGSIDFEPLITREFDYRKFIGIPTRLNKMVLTASGQIDVNMSIFVQCDAKFEYHANILIGRIEVPVPVGPVPVTVQLSFYLGFDANMEAEITATAGFTSNYQVAFGAEYDRNAEPKWKEVWERDANFTPHEPTFSFHGRLSAKGYIKPELAIMITGMAGPNFSVEPYLRFSGELDFPDWQWELGAGIGGSLGFRVGLFDYYILDYDIELFNWDKVIATGSSVLQPQFGTVSDIDGNTYQTVIIGKQEWMAENLKTTRYNDGTAIPLVTDYGTWNYLTTPAYCWYDNDISNKNFYGALYNAFTVNTGKLCPAGWHVPADWEWWVLLDYLGELFYFGGYEGGKLKSTRISPNSHPRWDSPNNGATNETGFSALPGGYRGEGFSNLGSGGFWWTSTQGHWNFNWSLSSSDSWAFWHRSFPNEMGFSVRCVKD